LNVRSKKLLIISVTCLIIVGLSYSIALGQELKDNYTNNVFLIELIPEECKVLDMSEGVSASVEFIRDEFGNIVDKTFIHLLAENIYAGASVTYAIALRNISSLALSVDHYTISIDGGSNSLEDLIRFSGSVKIYRSESEYDVLGSFSNIRIDELAQNLTNIMKYRKIDITEKIVIELEQFFENSSVRFKQDEGFSYKLVPVFIQYFP